MHKACWQAACVPARTQARLIPSDIHQDVDACSREEILLSPYRLFKRRKHAERDTVPRGGITQQRNTFLRQSTAAVTLCPHRDQR
jgi:hypothetical protein